MPLRPNASHVIFYEACYSGREAQFGRERGRIEDGRGLLVFLENRLGWESMIGKWVAASAAVVCLMALQVQAETVEPENSEEWFIGPRIGLSTFTGLVGIEVQRKQFGFSIGLLADGEACGLRYYFSPQGPSWYLGPFLMLSEEEYSGNFYATSETRETIVETMMDVGIGAGYRWRWGSGWDLSIGGGVAYWAKEEKGDTTGHTADSSGLWFIPELAFGYSF